LNVEKNSSLTIIANVLKFESNFKYFLAGCRHSKHPEMPQKVYLLELMANNCCISFKTVQKKGTFQLTTLKIVILQHQ